MTATSGVLAINQFYALGTTLDQCSNTKLDPDDIDGNTGTGVDVGGKLSGATVSRYDSVGRLAEQQYFKRASGWDFSGTSSVPTTPVQCSALIEKVCRSMQFEERGSKARIALTLRSTCRILTVACEVWVHERRCT